jgi:F-type H+-transporting ATPase subunit b
MPQFDLSTYFGQIVWLFLTFSFLYAVVTWIFLPRIRRGLMKREETLSGWLEEASELRDSAALMSKDADLRLQAARGKAQDHVREALETLKKRQEEEEGKVLLRMEEAGLKAREELEQLWKTWEKDLDEISDDLASCVMAKMEGESSLREERKG